MLAYRIEWHETERGWGTRPDGYSFHTSPEAAREYLSASFASLPDRIPDEYSMPSNGWRLPAIATPVEIEDGGLIGAQLAAQPTLRVYRTFSDSVCGQEYKEARSLQACGKPIEISYGEQGYTPAEVELMDMRREVTDSYESGEISPARALSQSQAIMNYLGLGNK